MSYAIYRPRPDIVQIALPNPGLPRPLGLPCNVYVILGEAPALVGAGHPRAFEALREALASLHLRPEDIQRVVATDWTPSMLAGALAFERADLFALSPDMVQPRHYGAWAEQARHRMTPDVDELLADPRYAKVMARDAHEAALDLWFGALPERLPVTPLRDGHVLRLGAYSLRVMDTPGPADGHLALYDDARGLLFSGRLVIEHAFGEPMIEEAKATLTSLEQIFELNPKLLLPGYGSIDEDAAWAARRSHRSLTGWLSNLPYVLQGPMTLPDLLMRDMGHIPSHLTRYLHTMNLYRAVFDELVRTGVILTAGEGVWKRYGTSEPDPRVARG